MSGSRLDHSGAGEVDNLDIRIIHRDTGELLRDLSGTYQPQNTEKT